MREGLTIAVSDLLDKLPLEKEVSSCKSRAKAGSIRLFSLQCCEGGLDLVVLVVFVLDIVVYARYFLCLAVSTS